ncbi:MAG: flagellin [Pseudomonadota bacterium]
MAVKLGSTVDSLRALRQLDRSSSILTRSLERLSTGLRINRASDDAAGLAIAESLGLRSRVFSQAIRNVNDGVSALTIADSAVESLITITTRIRELANQASTGSYSNDQRRALDTEAQALAEEYLRVTQSTSFNGRNLLDGSLGTGLSLQLGFGSEGAIVASVGGALGAGSYSTQTLLSDANQNAAIAVGDLNGDGTPDVVGVEGGNINVFLLRADGSLGESRVYSTGADSLTVVRVGDLNNDGRLDIVAGGSSGGDGRVSVLLGDGAGGLGVDSGVTDGGLAAISDIELGDLNGDGYLDVVAADSGNTVSSRLGSGSGAFGSATSFSLGVSPSIPDIALGDFNGDGRLDLGGGGFGASLVYRSGAGNGSFGAASTLAVSGVYATKLVAGDFNGDGIDDLVGLGDQGFAYSAGASGGLSSPVTGVLSLSSFGPTSLVIQDLNGDGRLDLVSGGAGGGSGRIFAFYGSGGGSFSVGASFNAGADNVAAVASGDFDGDGVPDIVGSDSAESLLTTFRSATISGNGALEPFSLKNIGDARQALGRFDRQITNLSNQRGIIGAMQSRLTAALGNLSATQGVTVAAASRIRDVDVAAESGEVVRARVLREAGAAVAAQANLSPQLALQLLRG